MANPARTIGPRSHKVWRVSGRRAGQRFDADHGVTTEALVFLGELDPEAIGPSLEYATHYEATPVAHAEALLDASPLDPRHTTFVDLGAGMGRVVLLAARRPFRAVIGVEISPALVEIARENLAAMRDPKRVARAGTDGRARLYSTFAQAPHVYSGWGSDIAAVQSSYGSGWQVLVSRPGDREQPDAVQAMEVVDREPVPVSTALDVPGAITSMWRSADGKSVNLVTQDVVSKKYEASILSIDCH